MPLLTTAFVPGGEFDYSCPCDFAAVPRAFGRAGGRRGGAGVTVGAIRVTFWGALAMRLTAGVGALFGTVV